MVSIPSPTPVSLEGLNDMLSRSAEEAAQTLRLAARLSAGEAIRTQHLRQALQEPVACPLPPTRVKIHPTLLCVLLRAQQLATERAAESLGREHLREALLETEARSVGLKLERLNFARHLLRQGLLSEAERDPRSTADMEVSR